MRVAVIGSGVAGLSACRALAGRAEVALFDARDRPGGHVCTAVDPATGQAVDMGFIVWNRERYPRFGAMLGELGIDSVRSDMSFSVSSADGGFELGSRDLSAWFAQRRRLLSPAHYRRLVAVVAFLRHARADRAAGRTAGRTVGEYLDQRRVGAALRAELIEPLAAALWSMAPDRCADFPADTLLGFLEQHGMLRSVRPLPWWSIRGGSRRYVDAVVDRLRAGPGFALHLDTAVSAVRRSARGIELDAGGATRRFDRIVLAVHADTALAILDADELERDVLGAVGFSDNEVVLHTDRSLLPRAPAARASWNYVAAADRSRVAVSYWMNRLQAIEGEVDYIVTLNPCRAIDPARVLRRERMRHPIFDLTARAAQARLPRLQGRGRCYFAGAWTGYGFHEDGMRSGLAAAARVLADEAVTT